MKVLVTGANGLVGANLSRELLRKGYEVYAMVRRGSDLRSLEGLPVSLVYGDIFDSGSLQRACHGMHWVFHTAAVFTYFGYSSKQLHDIAVDGTASVIEACHRCGVARLVFTSSSVTMGSSKQKQLRNEACDPDRENAPYLQAKIKQEQQAFTLANSLGLEVVAVCPTMSVGAHGYKLGPSNGLIITYLSDPFRMTFPGGCNIVSIKDIARGHLLAAQQGQNGERYLLGSENLSWPQLHTIIAELCGLPPPRIELNHTASFLAATAEELACRLVGKSPLTTRDEAQMVGRYYWYSHARAAALGYQPMPARQAIIEAIAWLIGSEHVSRKLRSTLSPSREVYQAREQLLAEEAELRENSHEAL